METIAASRFKERCLQILDELGPEGIIISKHGRPVARLLPLPNTHQQKIGLLRDSLKIRGDILSTGRRWDAQS